MEFSYFEEGHEFFHLFCLSFCLSGCLAVWLSGCLSGWLSGWLSGCLAGCLAGWVSDWLAGWLAGWLDGWLAGWLYGSLSGYLPAWLVLWKYFFEIFCPDCDLNFLLLFSSFRRWLLSSGLVLRSLPHRSAHHRCRIDLQRYLSSNSWCTGIVCAAECQLHLATRLAG